MKDKYLIIYNMIQIILKEVYKSFILLVKSRFFYQIAFLKGFESTKTKNGRPE